MFKNHIFRLKLEQRKIAANYYNSWKFTGKELDEETGFYYFGARYYQPKWSIWLSVDPLAEKYSSWSSYNYTMNNPINLIDPDGKRVCPPGVDCDNPLIELYYSIKETLEHSKRRRKKDKERMKSDIKKAKNKVGEGLSNLSSMLSKLEINLPGGLMLSKDKGAAQGDSELIREGGRISGDEENGEWVDISILLNGPFVPGKGVIMKGNKYNRMANKIDDVAEGSNRLREANEKRKDQQSKSDKIFKCKACSRIGRDSIYKVNNDGKIELNINQLVDPENTRSTH
ncbi:MAG: RHS repeat domain-containing protein [Bacteroidota bacterium]